MNPRVSVPKIFLRGNRWYVRVQVPRSMRDRLGRREYWVSLRTSDRSVAMQRAATAAQKKRHEVVSAFRLMGGAAEYRGGHVDGPTGGGWLRAAAEDTTVTAAPFDSDGAINTASTGGQETPTSVASRSGAKRVSPRKAATADLVGKFDALSKRQLIDLLVQQEWEKAFGLVWERNAQQDDPDSNDLVLARIDTELSERSSPWVNMIIEADNIDALRWLRMTHQGQIRCIFVDPPYGTGNRGWVYNDEYVDKRDRYPHSTWLEFLYRRLTLARDLLAEDGVLMVSINDDQRAKLEMLMDEALPGMRMGSFVWRTRTNANDTRGSFLSDNHEHVLVYGKPGFRFSGTEKTFESYRHWDEKKNDYYRPGGDLSKAHNRVERPNTYYPLHDPACDIWYPCNPDSVWRFSSRVYGVEGARIKTRYIEDFISDNYIDFPTDQRVAVWNSLDDLLAAIRSGDVPSSGNARFLREDTPNLEFWVGKQVGFGTPSLKRYKSELKTPTQPLSSWITPNSKVDTLPSGEFNEIVAGTSIEAAKSIKSIFGEKSFNYAKPVSLIRELVRQSTGPGDLVLDFFAGSATTAQAVMELNADDGMDRRFIMVSSTEATADDPRRNLCRDVTAKRIRRLNASTDPKYDGLVAGFAYLRTERIPVEHLDLALDPAIAWTSLEALHGLPLTPHDPDLPWNSHETAEFTLVLVDRFEPSLIEWLRIRQSPTHLYTWAKGRLQEHLAGSSIQVSLVAKTLVDAFIG